MPRNTRLPGALTLLALALLAIHATPPPAAAQSASSPEATHPAGASPGTAVAVSAFATAIPMGAGLATGSPELFAAGLYLGPATGYWLGGAAGRGWRGVGLRAGASLAGGLLVSAVWGSDGGLAPSDGATALGVGVLGALLYLAVDDIVRVDDAVAAATAERAAAAGQARAVRLAPVVSASGGGTVGFMGSWRP